MNNTAKLRMFFIRLIAGSEPILLNFTINPALVVSGASAIYLPCADKKIDSSELISKAVLTPTRNHK